MGGMQEGRAGAVRQRRSRVQRTTSGEAPAKANRQLSGASMSALGTVQDKLAIVPTQGQFQM